jgi:hypothetical protein
MPTDQEVSLTLTVSNHIGYIAQSLVELEQALKVATDIVLEQQVEQPENTSVPIMLNLFQAAKALIDAHKTIERVAEIMMSGGMQHEGPDQLM